MRQMTNYVRGIWLGSPSRTDPSSPARHWLVSIHAWPLLVAVESQYADDRRSKKRTARYAIDKETRCKDDIALTMQQWLSDSVLTSCELPLTGLVLSVRFMYSL